MPGTRAREGVWRVEQGGGLQRKRQKESETGSEAQKTAGGTSREWSKVQEVTEAELKTDICCPDISWPYHPQPLVAVGTRQRGATKVEFCLHREFKLVLPLTR